MSKGCEELVGLSDGELEALAEGMLAPSNHAALGDLLARNAEGLLSSAEQVELDRLLDQIDQLTILKARARLTLFRRT